MGTVELQGTMLNDGCRGEEKRGSKRNGNQKGKKKREKEIASMFSSAWGS